MKKKILALFCILALTGCGEEFDVNVLFKGSTVDASGRPLANAVGRLCVTNARIGSKCDTVVSNAAGEYEMRVTGRFNLGDNGYSATYTTLTPGENPNLEIADLSQLVISPTLGVSGSVSLKPIAINKSAGRQINELKALVEALHYNSEKDALITSWLAAYNSNLNTIECIHVAKTIANSENADAALSICAGAIENGICTIQGSNSLEVRAILALANVTHYNSSKTQLIRRFVEARRQSKFTSGECAELVTAVPTSDDKKALMNSCLAHVESAFPTF